MISQNLWGRVHADILLYKPFRVLTATIVTPVFSRVMSNASAFSTWPKAPSPITSRRLMFSRGISQLSSHGSTISLTLNQVERYMSVF